MSGEDQPTKEPVRKLQLAGCVIENNEGKVLLLHRNAPERKQWETPGGKIDPGEDPTLTAKREVAEELGIEVDVQDEIGRHDFTEDGHNMGYVWYRARIISGVPSPVEDKHDSVSYFSWEELRGMEDLSPNTRNLVDFHFSQDVTSA